MTTAIVDAAVDVGATMFTECSVDGATLQFHPCLSPYGIDVLEPVIHPGKMATLYSLAYQLPESYFSKTNN